jgi:hypothetical protein
LTDKVNSLLKQTEKIIEKYDAIDKATGGKFNIFTILERDRSETRHSRFLAELLNPKGLHGQGGLYLKLFYKIFEEEFTKRWICENTFFDIEEFSKKAWVHTEQSNSVENRQGYIDIVIENEQYAIVIENKIDAGDQGEQLYRYAESKKHKSLLLIYLTPDGRGPSNNSKGVLETEKIVLLSYSTHILEWLTYCIRESATLPSIRETLVQYEKLLRKITNQNGVDVEKEMIDFLLKDGNIKVAQEIYNTLPKARATLELRFWKKLSNHLSSKLLQYEFELLDKYDENKMLDIIINRTKNSMIVIPFSYQKKEYDNGKYFYFFVGYEVNKDEFYIGCYPKDKDGDMFITDGSSECVKILNDPFKNNLHYQYLGKKIGFNCEGLFELLEPAKCEELAQDTVKDIEPILANLQNSIKNYFVSSNNAIV